MDAPDGGAQEKAHTDSFYLPSAGLALVFLAKRISLEGHVVNLRNLRYFTSMTCKLDFLYRNTQHQTSFLTLFLYTILLHRSPELLVRSKNIVYTYDSLILFLVFVLVSLYMMISLQYNGGLLPDIVYC